MVERHCSMARRFGDMLANEPGISVPNEIVLNQLIVRFGADEPITVGDDLTLRTIRRIRDEGTLFAGGAKWRGEWVMRLSVINVSTTEEDVDQCTEAILSAWREERGLL
jgi:glutamate/tyrosine decarboxylase-like PLP-dependent enzyme